MMAPIALALRNTSRAAAHTAISWETVTASSKMDYSYNILISSLHALQVRPVFQKIWCRCQHPLGSTWQVPALHVSLPVAAPTHLKRSPNITQQVCISLRVRTSCQIFVISFLYCCFLQYLHGICRRRMSLTDTQNKIPCKRYNRSKTHC